MDKLEDIAHKEPENDRSVIHVDCIAIVICIWKQSEAGGERMDTNEQLLENHLFVGRSLCQFNATLIDLDLD